MSNNITRLDEFKRNSAAGSRAHVRVTDPDHHGFVEFQFSLGDPTLYLEMTLPPAAFREFCAAHNATPLSDEQSAAVDAAENKWRYGADNED